MAIRTAHADSGWHPHPPLWPRAACAAPRSHPCPHQRSGTDRTSRAPARARDRCHHTEQDPARQTARQRQNGHPTRRFANSRRDPTGIGVGSATGKYSMLSHPNHTSSSGFLRPEVARHRPTCARCPCGPVDPQGYAWKTDRMADAPRARQTCGQAVGTASTCLHLHARRHRRHGPDPHAAACPTAPPAQRGWECRRDPSQCFVPRLHKRPRRCGGVQDQAMDQADGSGSIPPSGGVLRGLVLGMAVTLGALP